MRTLKMLLFLAAIATLTGCGGGGGGGNDIAPPPPVSVTVSPASGSLEIGETLQFSSEVNRDSYVVSWYVNDILGGNETVGTITNGGLYTAPASVPDPSTVTVKAIPAADTTKSDTSPVTIYPKMAVSPAVAVTPAGKTQQFTSNKAATWFVNDIQGGNATVGTISSSGLYTAPASVPSPATVTIKAAWQLNGAKSATASVTVTDPSSVTISPTAVTLAAGATQQSDGPFNASSISGTYGFGLRGTQLGSSTIYSGQLAFDGESGTISGIADINEAGEPQEGIAVTGAYTMSANGRGVASLLFGAASSTMSIYIVDLQTLLLIENNPAVPSKFGPAQRQF
jgi:hypothetical protein